MTAWSCDAARFKGRRIEFFLRLWTLEDMVGKYRNALGESKRIAFSLGYLPGEERISSRRFTYLNQNIVRSLYRVTVPLCPVVTTLLSIRVLPDLPFCPLCSIHPAENAIVPCSVMFRQIAVAGTRRRPPLTACSFIPSAHSEFVPRCRVLVVIT